MTCHVATDLLERTAHPRAYNNLIQTIDYIHLVCKELVKILAELNPTVFSIPRPRAPPLQHFAMPVIITINVCYNFKHTNVGIWSQDFYRPVMPSQVEQDNIFGNEDNEDDDGDEEEEEQQLQTRGSGRTTQIPQQQLRVLPPCRRRLSRVVLHHIIDVIDIRDCI
ncbi:hypothetical protein Lal_00026809 [Lupinus albus]|nr:hypothetical protein Lal_00026809 [Lupinus albus]